MRTTCESLAVNSAAADASNPKDGQAGCSPPKPIRVRVGSWTAGGSTTAGRAVLVSANGEEPACSVDAELVAEQVGVRGDANEPGTL